MGKNIHLFKKILLLAFFFNVLFPLAIILLWSFTERWSWPYLLPQELSLRGMQEIFGSYSGALQTLGSSILISLIVAFWAVVLGLMTSRALVFYDFYGKSLIEMGTILPIIIPGTVFAMGIHVLFLKYGLADRVSGVILVHLICALPYTVKIMTDVTSAFGRKFEEQAIVLGASRIQAFKEITLPCLLPGIISSASMAYIISFSQYFLTLIIGGGNVKTFMVIMVPYLQSGDRTIASAYSLVFICSTLLVFVIFEKAIKKYHGENNNYFFI